jgi:hypothetical protein
VSIDEATPEEWNRASASTVIINPVTKPAHYNKGGIEAIDYIKQQLGTGFGDYCSGNVMKYLHRYKYKNGVEDLKKARQYLDWLIEDISNEGN